MSEKIYELLPLALQNGINLFDFWKMSLREVQICCEAYSEAYSKKQENDYEAQKQMIYVQSTLIAYFVGKVLNGERIPSYEAIFDEESNQEGNIDFLREQLIDFANEANKRSK